MQGQRFDWSRATALVLAGALVVGAALLIVTMLGEHGYDAATAPKVFLVTIPLLLIAPIGATGLHLIQRRPRLGAIGLATVAMALFAFIAIAVHILEGAFFLGGNWHLQGVALSLALATGQISLILAYDSDEDPLLVRLVTAAALLAIVVLGVVAAYEATGAGGNLSANFFGVVTTLYLLGVALLVLLHMSEWIRRRGVRPTLEG